MREDRGCLFMSSILTPLLFYNWAKSNVPRFSWQICWYFWGKWSLIGCQCCSRQKLVKSPESPTFLFRHCQLKGQNSKSMLPHHFTCQFKESSNFFRPNPREYCSNQDIRRKANASSIWLTWYKFAWPKQKFFPLLLDNIIYGVGCPNVKQPTIIHGPWCC